MCLFSVHYLLWYEVSSPWFKCNNNLDHCQILGTRNRSQFSKCALYFNRWTDRWQGSPSSSDQNIQSPGREVVRPLVRKPPSDGSWGHLDTSTWGRSFFSSLVKIFIQLLREMTSHLWFNNVSSHLRRQFETTRIKLITKTLISLIKIQEVIQVVCHVMSVRLFPLICRELSNYVVLNVSSCDTYLNVTFSYCKQVCDYIL